MRLSRQRLKWPVVVAAGVVLAGGGTAYAVTSGEDSPDYRTVTATEGDVEQTLTLTGLVDAADRSDLSFGTGGTVASVKVAQGDRVRAGQVIATLDTESLDADVTAAVATLAEARAQLESDQDAQTSSVQNAVSPSGSTSQPTGKPTGSSTGKPSGSSASDPTTAALLKKLKAQQQAVLTARSAATAAIKAAKEALAAQTAACARAYQEPSATPSPAADDSTTDTSTEATEPETGTDDACTTALADVQAKQDAVKQAQDTLQQALEDLSTTLSAALGTVTQQTQQPQSQARTTAESPTGSTGSTGSSGQGSGPQSSGQTVTAAQLASDQARIDQAEADLITARQARAQAVLRATRSGTVASLDLARGDAVSTGTTVATVIGGRAVTLTGTVTETNVGKLKVGQTARVTVPGSETSATGTVTAIGMTADSSTGTTSYPVTVAVEDPAIALPTGSRAQVSIVLATAEDVVTVPLSAVTRAGTGAVVRIWDGRTLQRTSVTLGAVGARSVAVTDGLSAGTEVVLADKDQAITGASSELNQRGNFGGPPVTFRQGGPGGTGPGAVTLSR